MPGNWRGTLAANPLAPRLVIEHARDPKLRKDLRLLMVQTDCYGYAEVVRKLMRLYELATDEQQKEAGL